MSNELSFEVLPNDPSIIDLISGWNEAHWNETNPELKDAISFKDFYTGAASSPEDALPQVFIARLNGEVVGTISLIEEPDETVGPWGSNLFVDPEHRNNGLGGFLMEMMIGVAQARGITKLYGWTSSNQEEFYYRKRGWKLIETRPNDVIIIEKEL